MPFTPKPKVTEAPEEMPRPGDAVHPEASEFARREEATRFARESWNPVRRDLQLEFPPRLPGPLVDTLLYR
jgi:hypothetical protein